MQCRIWHYSLPVLSTTWIWPYILPVLFLLSSTNKVPVNVTSRTKHFTKKYSLGGVGLGWRQKMTALLRCLRVSAADWSCLFVALTIDGHVLDDAEYIHTILNKHSWHSFNIYRYYQLWKDQHPTPSRTAIATPQQQNLNTDEAERFCDVADKWNEYQQHVEWVGCKHWGANESCLWVLMRAYQRGGTASPPPCPPVCTHTRAYKEYIVRMKVLKNIRKYSQTHAYRHNWPPSPTLHVHTAHRHKTRSHVQTAFAKRFSHR